MGIIFSQINHLKRYTSHMTSFDERSKVQTRLISSGFLRLTIVFSPYW